MDRTEAAMQIFELVTICFRRFRCLDVVTLANAKWILQQAIVVARRIKDDDTLSDTQNKE